MNGHGCCNASDLRYRDPAYSLRANGLELYLAVGYTPAPRTCFRGIRKLKAGHCLIVERGDVREETFWSLSYRKSAPPPDEREYAEDEHGDLSLLRLRIVDLGPY